MSNIFNLRPPAKEDLVYVSQWPNATPAPPNQAADFIDAEVARILRIPREERAAAARATAIQLKWKHGAGHVGLVRALGHGTGAPQTDLVDAYKLA